MSDPIADAYVQWATTQKRVQPAMTVSADWGASITGSTLSITQITGADASTQPPQEILGPPWEGV